MNAYLYPISEENLRKLQAYTFQNNITLECALEDIVSYIRTVRHASNLPTYMREIITGKDIEEIVEMIFVS